MGEIKNFSLLILTLFVVTLKTNADPRVILCEKYVDSLKSTKNCLMNDQTVIDSPDYTIALQDENVRWLEFGNNRKISFLPVDAYKSFTNLTYYGAASCSLKVIGRQNFKQLYNVFNLNLHDNQILKIHSDTFSDLFSLKYLELDDNNILNLNGESIFGLTRLSSFKIGPNDCFNSKEVEEFSKRNIATLPSLMTERCGFDEIEYFAKIQKPTEQEKLERKELLARFEAEFKEKDKNSRKAVPRI